MKFEGKLKILITGTAGFIGMHLALKLNALGHEVIGLDNINSYYNTNLKYDRLYEQGFLRDDIYYNKLITGKKGIRFIELDLQDAGNLQALFSKNQFDIIVNLAAQAGVRYSITNPKDYIDSNITGFFNILEACRNFPVKHLIYASSSSVYGNSAKIPFKESDATDEPISFYAATKKSNEVMAHTYSSLYGIKATGLRFFTVYGPWGRPDMAMFLFTKAILNGETIKVFNHGNLLRDFTYIDDIVEGICAIISKNNPIVDHKIYNIGNGSPVKLIEFIDEIEKSLGISAIKENYPLQDGDVLVTFASTFSLLSDFGYQPSVSINEGVGKFIDWYKSYFKD
jgi:UDP-glucuronate 4-epimerase